MEHCTLGCFCRVPISSHPIGRAFGGRGFSPDENEQRIGDFNPWNFRG
jgi:hypothetical protein